MSQNVSGVKLNATNVMELRKRTGLPLLFRSQSMRN